MYWEVHRSGQGRGRFAGDAVLSKGSLARRVDAVGCFASDAEFSKGCRHFASVITLAKCGSAVKPEASLSKQTPSRAPRPPGRRESHWGTLAALGQVSPHWGRLLTCPNGPLPTPNAPLPAPTTRCLPQCGSSPLHDRTTSEPAAPQQEATEPSITTRPRTRFRRPAKPWVLWFRPLSFLLPRAGSALASARRRPVRGGGGRSRTSGPGPRSPSRPRRDSSTNPHARTGAHCG